MTPGSLPRKLSAADVAAACNFSERHARRLAVIEDWKTTHNKTQGGNQKEFIIKSMPHKRRLQLANYISQNACPIPSGSSSAAAVERGNEIVEETARSEEAKRQARETGLSEFKKLSEARKKEAKAKFEILQALRAFLKTTGLPVKRGSTIFATELKAGTIKLEEWIIDAAAKRNGKISISYPTLNRWMKAEEEAGLFGLSGKYTAPKTTSIPTHMQDFVIGMLYEFPHVKAETVRKGLSARFDGQEIPHISSIRRFIAKWKVENKSLFLNRTNPDKWKSSLQFAAGNASENITRLNQLWEMDSTPGDVMLTDGRHTVIGVIDVMSRRSKLLVAPVSKAVHISALMRRAMLDWGVPEAIKTDNGKDYTARHIVRVLASLEIDHILCAPFTPEQKPHVERAFRTFAHDIVELLPGFIGHNVPERKAIEARKTFAQRMMKQGNTVEIKMSSAEFQDFCDRWINAVHHQNPHKGLDGMTPAEAARRWTEPIRKIENERALDMLLCPAPNDGGYRTIKKKGVEVEGGFYLAVEMAGHEAERAQVLLDHTDFGTVYIYRENGSGMEFLCRAIDPDRVGINRAELAKRMKTAQKQAMAQGRKELRKIAREVKVDTIYEEILAHREKEIRNVVDMPRPTEPYTTQGLYETGLAAADERRKTEPTKPIDITPEQEETAREVIALSDRKKTAALPASEYECYQMLEEETASGIPITVNEENWMKDYEDYLLTGKRRGLLEAGFQPFAERNRVSAQSHASV